MPIVPVASGKFNGVSQSRNLAQTTRFRPALHHLQRVREHVNSLTDLIRQKILRHGHRSPCGDRARDVRGHFGIVLQQTEIHRERASISQTTDGIQ